MRNNWISPVPDGCVINVKVKAGAKKNAIVGVLGNVLKIQIKAIPQKGNANRALIKYFSKLLELKGPQVSIIKGLTSCQKKLHIKDADIAVLCSVFEELCQ